VQPVQHLRDGRAPGSEGGGGGGPCLSQEGTGDGSRLVAGAEKSREPRVLTPEDGTVALRNSFSHSAGGWGLAQLVLLVLLAISGMAGNVPTRLVLSPVVATPHGIDSSVWSEGGF